MKYLYLYHDCDFWVEDWDQPLCLGPILFFPQRCLDNEDVEELMEATDGAWQTPGCGAPTYVGYIVNPAWN